MSGFEFHEKMSGTWTRDGDERPFHFEVTVRAAQLLRFLRDRRATISGLVHAGGLAESAPLAGSMVIDPLLGHRIAYEFTFTGDDDKPYRFAGQKDVTPASPVMSMTELPGELTDGEGNKIASAQLSFDLRHLPRFLASFRPLV